MEIRLRAFVTVVGFLGGLAWGSAAYAQSNTRLLLASGWGVPGHAGYAFGPFSNLAMNGAKEMVFLSTLRGAKGELRAVVRSRGVSFSVVAFEGLQSRLRKAFYESFSAPSVNDAGVIDFTANLRDETPTSAVIRVEGANVEAIAASGDAIPGMPDAVFEDFSAPLISSGGNILFGARLGGKQPGTALLFWTPRGIKPIALPPELKLAPKDLLEPIFFGHDEAVFVPRGAPAEGVTDQFFRAVAIKNFQELKPPPSPADVTEILAPRPGETPVKMLLVLLEGDKVETAALDGDPSQAVSAKPAPGAALKPLARIWAQTAGALENIIFAAAPADHENDLALYCYCNGQVNRLTSPDDFRPITEAAKGRPMISLVSDSRETVAFIASGGSAGESGAIYVTSLP